MLHEFISLAATKLKVIFNIFGHDYLNRVPSEDKLNEVVSKLLIDCHETECDNVESGRVLITKDDVGYRVCYVIAELDKKFVDKNIKDIK